MAKFVKRGWYLFRVVLPGGAILQAYVAQDLAKSLPWLQQALDELRSAIAAIEKTTNETIPPVSPIVKKRCHDGWWQAVNRPEAIAVPFNTANHSHWSLIPLGRHAVLAALLVALSIKVDGAAVVMHNPSIMRQYLKSLKLSLPSDQPYDRLQLLGDMPRGIRVSLIDPGPIVETFHIVDSL